MGKYLAYESYKDSGLEWLGDIPEHWKAKRLKNVASCNDESLSEDCNPLYEIEYVDISSVDLVSGIIHYENMIFDNAPSRARRKVRDGDTIISTVRTYLKAITAIKSPPDNLIVSTGFAVIRPKKLLDSQYIGYLLQSEGFIGDVVANSVGVSYPAINSTVLTRLPVVEPPLEEQKAIARFLDYKTNQIDALIAKKEALLKKLDEKRTALISHAVTKGLDANVPMKDSGIEWLGEIPEHFSMTRLRYLVSKIEQGWSPSCHNQTAEPDEWGVLKAGCVNGETFDENENKTLPDELEPKYQYEVKHGDILMSRANTKELLGSAAIAINPRRKLILCDKLYRLSVKQNVDRRYLIRLLRSFIARFQYERDATGSSGSMQNIGQDTIKDLILPLPSLDKQKEIVEYLERKTAEIDAQKAKIQQAINLLKEYRTALITNAVTGKIDVRQVPIPQQQI